MQCGTEGAAKADQVGVKSPLLAQDLHPVLTLNPGTASEHYDLVQP